METKFTKSEIEELKQLVKNLRKYRRWKKQYDRKMVKQK